MSLFGIFSIFTGLATAYRTQYQHPQYQYLPPDKNWESILVPASSASQTAQTEPDRIWIEVAGAVEHPGVYTVSYDSRIQEAVLQAGGFTSDADRQYIHQQLNLASRMQDQEKIYIPFVGETAPIQQPVLSTTVDSAVHSADGLVALSQATQTELETVNGIGPKRAAAIIANGPYSDWEELREKAELTAPILIELQKRYLLK